jgi:hypothetical protein
MSDYTNDYWLNRTLCDIIDDARTCDKTKNYGPLMSLLQELQIRGNRMEAALGDLKGIKNMSEEWHKMKQKLKKLQNEVKQLQEKKKSLK